MDLAMIEGLIKLVEKSSLTEFTIKEGELELSMSKAKYLQASGEAAMMMPQTLVAESKEEEEEETFITSPIVGTFYCAASPNEPSFVKVGDIVKAGQKVCILEAMKLMNEIQSDFDCEIEAVLVSNEQKVEYGQPLFRVKKV